MCRKIIFLSLSILSLSAFTLLSKYEDRAVVRNLDFAVTVKVQDRLNRHFGSRLDGFFEDVGVLASPGLSLIGIIVITFIAFIKTKGWRRLLSLGIPLAFVLLTLVEIYGKTIVRHPAPPFFMLKNPTTIFPTYYVWQEFSYPSGHAARAMFLSFLIFSLITCHLSPRKQSLRTGVLVGTVLLAYVGLVSLTRIYLGHHWLSDVVGGWLLGAGFGVIYFGLL